MAATIAIPTKTASLGIKFNKSLSVATRKTITKIMAYARIGFCSSPRTNYKLH